MSKAEVTGDLDLRAVYFLGDLPRRQSDYLSCLDEDRLSARGLLEDPSPADAMTNAAPEDELSNVMLTS